MTINAIPDEPDKDAQYAKGRRFRAEARKGDLYRERMRKGDPRSRDRWSL